MSDLGHNPRYVNFARSNGRTPAEQIQRDKKEYPGGCMIPFVEWNRERIREFANTHPELCFMGTFKNAEDYDAWLTKWVDERTAK